MVKSMLTRRGVLDEANARSMHVSATPRGGGIACAAALIVSAGAAHAHGQTVEWNTIVGPLALAVVGFIDDQTDLSPKSRLATQVGIGAATGMAISRGVPLSLVGAIATPAIVNATNFMDGINGISSLTAVSWGSLACHPSFDMSVQTLGEMTAGAFMGFLPYNAPHAQLFLGDVGSYLLGGIFSVAFLATLHSRGVKTAFLMIAPLSFYGADTAITLAHRYWRGERLTDAHREHAYQRLVSPGGLSHLQAAITVVGASTVAALAVRRRSGWPAAAVLIGGVLALPGLLQTKERR